MASFEITNGELYIKCLQSVKNLIFSNNCVNLNNISMIFTFRNNDQCWYEINAPAGQQVQLSIVTFSTESGYDYL